MNGRTSRLLRRQALNIGKPHRTLKAQWRKLNWIDRTRLRKAIKASLGE